MADQHSPEIWTTTSAWARVAPSSHPRPLSRDTTREVTIITMADQSIAIVMTSPKTRDAFAAAMQANYGIIPPDRPRRVASPDMELLWAGPDQWLARLRHLNLSKHLSEGLGGTAAIINISDARACLRISGPAARDVLVKGCMIDLHPSAFKPDDVALTSIAHMGVHLLQLDDAPTYELSVFRSMAEGMWSWLASSAAEFKLTVEHEA